ncbi:MAG: aldehyde dehydrogenase family protein [Candidatus Promineifilaceae bacterium]
MNAQAETISCFNPGTGEQFDQVPISTAADVDRAISELRQSSYRWQQKSVKERVRILRKFQAFIIDSVDIISETINLDTGKSRQDGLIEVMMTVDRLHQYYKRAPRWLVRKRIPPGLYIFKRFYAEPQPYGVVAVISPWNYPFDLTVSPICSALLAGNTVLVKPSEVTASTGVLIEKLVHSVPELSPFVRFVHGDGRVGEVVVKAQPDLVFLTGSVETGRKVAQAAAATLTPYLFELGGKDAMLILEDADIKAAARWGIWSACYNTGQTCVSIERAYAVEAVYDEFVREAVEHARQLTVGYSPDVDNPYHMAPLCFNRQQQIIEEQLAEAVDMGARILTGGQIKDLYAEPTVIIDVDQTMNLMREETFGPVLPIMKVKDEAEAIRLTNESEYGLSASVWSNDLERAQRVARQLAVGSVNINDATTHYPVSLLPFGGVKKSGSARTHGRNEVLQFTQVHSYAVGRPPHPLDIATQMRKPGHYRLGAAIMRLVFGVTPRQRVQPVVEELEQLAAKPMSRKPVAAVAAGLVVAALAFGARKLLK